MIKLVDKNQILIDYLIEDSAVNYFILITLEREKYELMYEKKWVQLDDDNNIQSILVKRKTGNMQFFSKGNYNVKELGEFLNHETFNKLIGERNVLEQLALNYKFSTIEEGSFICMLKHFDMDTAKNFKYMDNNYEIRKITLDDIDEIIEIYKKVFRGFATKQSMIDKLLNKSGRGYCLTYNKNIISVAQSSLEQDSSAIIVGVATLPEYRGKGFASSLTSLLCKELIDEGKTCFLHYENPEAGEIYKQIGFKDVGRMIMCSQI